MKKSSFIAVSISLLMLTSCANNPATNNKEEKVVGFTKIETVVKKGDEIVIPYSKYVLDNGLTVILHPDNSDPLVHVDITYHVGSGHEDIGKSGFAHFFEHMMFQGSENVDNNQHFGIITESGGTLNGSTGEDYTNYFETVPANQLERMLWLEADRMGFFLDAVTQEKFENQRETVKNERGQLVDNVPYGLLNERIGEAMYPEGHPYSWSIIGYLEDLDRANLNDLKKFFLHWYGPNNAALTIGGDFDQQQTLEWVAKYFGGIPRGPEILKPTYTPITLKENRYISLEDNVSLPLISMSYPTAHKKHRDEAPLDVLMTIVGEGKTSLLYKNLVKTGIAVQARGSHTCNELNCEFSLEALPSPGNTLPQLEKIIRDSLEEFEVRGAKQDDLDRVKANIVSGMIYQLESVRGKVGQLADYETFNGTPNSIQDDIARYENVTKEDVLRVYKKYIKSKPAVIMSIVPKGQKDAIAKPDTWQRYERDIPEDTPTELALRPGTSNFDRSKIPAPGPNVSIKVPELYNTVTRNGSKLTGAINNEVPTTSIRIQIPAGQTREPLNKLGLASLTASMMDEATRQSSAEDIASRLENLGSRVNFGADDLYSILNIRTLTKNLDQTLAIAVEKLTLPKFDEADFTRLKNRQIESLKLAQKNSEAIASDVFSKLLYGTDNSFAHSNSGTIETVESLTIDDVKSFYASHYGPKSTDIIVVSDLGQKLVTSKLRAFDDWNGGNTPTPDTQAFPALTNGTLYLIDKPNAAQSEIRIGKRSLNYDATGEHYRANLMNYNLGGAFYSRINLNLRENKGYTYGARSYFIGNNLYGQYRAQAGVRADSTAASIIEFRKEISNFRDNGITDKEMMFMKSAIGQRDARAYETPSQKLRFLSRIATYNLDSSFVDQQNSILAGITAYEINQLAKTHINLDDMITVVVGDKASVMESLKEISDNIVELDVYGKPVN